MMIKVRISIIVLLLLSGCATTNQVSQANLYWGNYSHTLYELKKSPTSETRAKHIAELNDIILKSQELNLRVPPGIYAELGLYSIEDGNQSKADKYFNLELSTYPEAKAMINQILNKG